jgi:hypothetical protein
MDGEATKKAQQQAQQRESEEAEQLEQEMREIEELLPRVKGEELRRALQEKYYELLKRKLKKESEETESEEMESEAESEAKAEAEPKEKEGEKLHSIKKFKIDEALINKILKNSQGQAHDFFVHLADILPKYFENDEEMRKYIKNKCYVGLRVKAKFTKEGDEKMRRMNILFLIITSEDTWPKVSKISGKLC